LAALLPFYPLLLLSPLYKWCCFLHPLAEDTIFILLYVKTINVRAYFAQIFCLDAIWPFYPLLLHSPLYKCSISITLIRDFIYTFSFPKCLRTSHLLAEHKSVHKIFCNINSARKAVHKNKGTKLQRL